ncbi:Phosphate metabolism protein [Lachnellula suecica]|uniref:Phosphate metabolism protein n=1 Tax=Lachnellula suecica TaxID=602035 RepID=A0A8T9CCY5_9HELO|nr:Phosphate metabolism protein [Lachnellula suecica]
MVSNLHPSTGSSTTSSSNSSSLSAMVSTLIPVALEAAVFVGLFLIFRTKFQRVYRPRTYHESLRDDEKTQELPQTKFGWLNPFKAMPDEYILTHQTLDGYLYLRFLKIITIICFCGAVFLSAVLMPVNGTGGGGLMQFDLLSFANINSSHKSRYYAHAFCGWIFFTFVMIMVTHETIYSINLRHAYLMAPFSSARISSRTVLFTDVPTEYLDQEKLFGLFGASMRRAWLATDCKKLTDKVEERDKDALKLEGAEIKLSQIANKRRLKWEKKNDTRKDAPYDGADAETAVPGAKFMKQKDRPTHRLGKIPFIGKKVDTIEWSRTELKRVIPEVETTKSPTEERMPRSSPQSAETATEE